MTEPDFSDGDVLLDDDFDVEVELGVSEREVLVAATRRTDGPIYPTDPPPEFPTWRAYFEHFQGVSRRTANIVDAPSYVEAHTDTPDLDALGGPIKALKARMEAAGWEVRLQHSVVHHPIARYKDDSKTVPKDGSQPPRRGDVKKESFSESIWWLGAIYPNAPLAFQSEWLEGVTAKGARSFRWQSARACDPVGIPVELYADYSIGAGALKALHHTERERAEFRATTRDYIYNDGASFVDRRPLFTLAGAFNDWLDDYVPKPAAPVKKTRTKKVAADAVAIDEQKEQAA